MEDLVSSTLGMALLMDTASWTQQLNQGEYYHYAGVYNGSTVVAYINGVEVGSGTFAGGALSNSGLDINLGRNPAYSGDYFQGAIYDARIYKSALTAAQILEIYQSVTLAIWSCAHSDHALPGKRDNSRQFACRHRGCDCQLRCRTAPSSRGH